MKPLRWLVGGVVWILAGLLGLVGVLLSVTVILLPLGIPIILLARRLFSLSAKLVLPRAVRQPGREAGEAIRRRGKDTQDAVKSGGKDLRRKSRKALKKGKASIPSPVEAMTPTSRRGFLGKIARR